MSKKYSRYKQGRFTPQNRDKYKGTVPIIYRSSWELAAFRWLDCHPKCVSWGSESAVVSYFLDGKKRRYFVDLTATFRTKDGIKKFYIEVKPYKQTIPPVPSKRKKSETLLQERAMWGMNQAKWEAAQRFARKKGGEFIVITEKQLGGLLNLKK